MPIKVEVIGADKLVAMGELTKRKREELMLDLAGAAKTFGLYAVYLSKTEYLSGPRPDKLAPVTGRLRSSITSKVERNGDVIETSIGTNVAYGAIHEMGGQVEATPSMYGFLWGKFKKTKEEKWKWMALGLKKKGHFTIPPRPYLRPALMDAIPSFRNNIQKILSTLSFNTGGSTPGFEA